MIAIIDYGMGNIHSVKKALETFGAKTIVASSPQDLLNADKAVLPGVGAFDDAMQALDKSLLIKAISEFIAGGKPFLGICLGMQILFEKSQEAKTKKGLGVLKGEVVRFTDKPAFKVPQIGWNELVIERKECPLLEKISSDSFVYFCHSYYPVPAECGICAATTNYAVKFASVVWKNNVYGVQFHPEKSQKTGLRMIDNFVNLC